LTRSIVGAALAAGAAYFFDPGSGRRRRLLLKDGCARAAHRLELGTRDARHGASERTQVLASRAKQALARRPRSDRAIMKHARTTVRECAAHPESISLAVDDGHVILRGTISPYEHQHVLNEVRRVPGVRVVTDHLADEYFGNGQYAWDADHKFKTVAGPSGWSIAGRVAAGCAGCALIAWGILEREKLREFGASVGNRLAHHSSDLLERGEFAMRQAGATARGALHEATEEVTSTARHGTDWAAGAARDAQMRFRQGDGASGASLGG
jgi:hypothetical protein